MHAGAIRQFLYVSAYELQIILLVKLMDYLPRTYAQTIQLLTHIPYSSATL